MLIAWVATGMVIGFTIYTVWNILGSLLKPKARQKTIDLSDPALRSMGASLRKKKDLFCPETLVDDTMLQKMINEQIPNLYEAAIKERSDEIVFRNPEILEDTRNYWKISLHFLKKKLDDAGVTYRLTNDKQGIVIEIKEIEKILSSYDEEKSSIDDDSLAEMNSIHIYR